jgi:hypothetical protein
MYNSLFVPRILMSLKNVFAALVWITGTRDAAILGVLQQGAFPERSVSTNAWAHCKFVWKVGQYGDKSTLLRITADKYFGIS